MSNTPFADVIVSFFGPSSTVIEFLVPRLVVATVPVGCYSGPNATSSEGAGAELFSIKPAGTEFIAFFVRGSRTYAFDTTTGNYCWIDNHYTPH